MGQEDDAAELVGLSIETAAERIAASGDRDAETVRETLAEISEEGNVTRSAIDNALGDLSKVVATPETRVEITRRALADAREAAAPVADADAVRSRLNEFESELSSLEERIDTLGSRLSSLVERAREPDDLRTIARTIRELRSDATDAQGDADSLAIEIETFESKLRDPGEWADELHEDIDAIEEAIEGLDITDSAPDTGDGSPEGADRALRWADATLQHRMQNLFIEDIRAELDALQRMIAHQDEEDPCDEIRTRLAELETLRTDVGRRLDDAAETSWRRNHSGTIESFSRTLKEFEPPVNWAELQNELEHHRKRISDPE